MKDAQCARCGFLAIRDKYNDATCQATDEARQTGRHNSSKGNSTPANFFCFKLASAFPTDALAAALSPATPPARLSLEEMAAGVPARGSDAPNALVEILNRKIDCDSFRPHRPGKSPKEREDMESLEQLQLLHLQHRTEDLAWQDKVHSENRRDFRWYLVLTAIIALAAIASLVMSIVALSKASH